jgi:hypothetical protein
MSARRIPSFVALLALGAVAAVVLVAPGGFASGKRETAPQASAETIQQCLKTLSRIQGSLNRLRKTREDVLAKRVYLYTIGRVSGHPVFTSVSVAEFKALVTAELLGGKLSSRELLQLVREMRQMTVENLPALEGYISVIGADAAKQKRHCDALGQGGTTTKPKPPAAAGAYTLRPALTEVKNPNAVELTINPTAGTAVDDHTGPNGGAGKGGEWKVNYSWKLPQTLTPGKTSQLTIGLDFVLVNPSQPLLQQIGALAPDFVGAVSAHWPDTPSASKTFDYQVHESQKAASDIAVTIGMLSATVTYHYRK